MSLVGGRFFLASSWLGEHKGRAMMRIIRPTVVLLLAIAATCITAAAAQNPFLGGWELTIPGGNAGWLGVEESNGRLQASMLWGFGSVEPTASARLEDARLVLTRNHVVEQKDASGKKVKKTIVET